MADLDRLKQALIAADAAGDADGARALAGAIREQMGASTPEASPPAKQSLTGAYKRVLGDAKEWEQGLSVDGLGRGITDLRDAGTQLIGHGLTAVSPAGSDLERYMQGETKRVEDRASQGEKAYQEQRAAEGRTGIDSGRLAGNVLSSLPFGFGMAGRSLPMRVAGNAAQGAVASSVTQPVFNPSSEESGDTFWQQKGKQAGLGATGAVAAMPVSAALSRVISPKASTDPNVQKLLGEGVTLTPGQMGGGMTKRLEDASTSVWGLGDLIRNAQRGGIEDLNRAALNRPLAPLGKTLPKSVDVGRDGVAFVQREVSNAYDNLLPKLNASVDQQFVADANQILQRLQATDPNIATQFSNTFQKMVVDRFAPNGQLSQIPGDVLKSIETDLGKISSSYKPKGGGEGMYGEAVSEIQQALRSLITRSNPQYGPELAKVNEAFKNLVVIDKAAGAQGSTGGIFSPAQLATGVKGADRSARGRAYAGGKATMQDLSDPAKAVMPSSVPDSGTPLRLGLTGAGILGGGYVNPLMAAPAGLAAGMYTGPGLWLMQQMMAKRPGWAPQAAQGLLGSTPALGAASAPPMMGLLN